MESMTVRYGVEGAIAKQAAVYVPAASVTDWGRVVGVRICLVMRSSEPVLTSEDLAIRNTYLNCNQVATTLPDRYARRAFFTTIALRNRMAY